MQDTQSLLKKLMQIPSTSMHEKDVLDFVFELLKNEGFNTKKYSVNQTRYNIVANLNPKPNIYLQAHLDTVEPFMNYSEDKKNIYGRGACDTKGSAAAMISAALKAKDAGLRNFGLIFTVGEEDVLDGATKLAKEIDIPFVIVGEPSSLDIINEHFGLLVFKVHAKGKAAHSSRPEVGLNAINLLLEFMNKTNSIKINPKTLMSITQIKGGIADNIIPESAQATYSFRISPGDTNSYFGLFSSLGGENIKLEKITDAQSVFTDVPKELDFIKTRRKVRYFTELSMFKKGVIIGPGDIKYAHGPNEQISKDELAKAVKIYTQIIKNFSTNYDGHV